MITSPNEHAPSMIEYKFNSNSNSKPVLNCIPRKPKASHLVMPPDTRGRSLVRATLASISLSHISLIVHPAPRIINAPEAKMANVAKSGKHPGDALNATLHPHGQNNNQVPIMIKYII